MKQDWYNLRYNFIGSDYDLPWLVDFYMKQPSFIAYKNLEAIRNYLVIFDYEVPEMIEDYLENSEHQNLKPGQKRSSPEKESRDMDIYLERNYSDINHGDKQQYYDDQADELGLHAKSYRNFNKIYENLQKERISAFKEFKIDVQKNKFPTKKHSISIEKKELLNFKKIINKKI